MKDYTFSNIPENSLSMVYYLLHSHLNFNTHQFISRNNSRENRDSIYHVVLFTTVKKTEEHSYSVIPIFSLSHYSVLMDSFAHCFFKLLSTHTGKMTYHKGSATEGASQSFGYFRDQFCSSCPSSYILSRSFLFLSAYALHSK